MTLTKIGSVAIRHANRSVLLQRIAINQTKPVAGWEAIRSMSKTTDLDQDLDKPIKFSSSEAASWKAEYSRMGGPRHDWPWWQPYVVSASVAVFLIYFCILREENDVDQKLTLQLSDHFQGEQKKNLEATFGLPEQIAKERSIRR